MRILNNVFNLQMVVQVRIDSVKILTKNMKSNHLFLNVKLISVTYAASPNTICLEDPSRKDKLKNV